MTVFRCMAYLTPLLAGLAVAASLAWAEIREKPVKTRVLLGAAVFGGFSALLLILWIPSGESFGAWPATVGFSLATSLFAVGILRFLRGFRLPPVGAQIVSSLLLILLFCAVFALGPVVAAADEASLPGEERTRIIHRIIAVCPYPVMSASIFNDNPLTHPILYATEAADYYDPGFIPAWTGTAFGYALAGLVFFGLGLGLDLAWAKFMAKPNGT